MSSPTSVVLSIFYVVIFLFASSDLKRFVFHVHISRVDRVPVSIDIDSSFSSTSLWYPITLGIIFNILILIFSTINFYLLLWRENSSRRLFVFTLILFFLFTIRFIINLILTNNRNGLSTPTLVERSFFATSLSLEEEMTTLTCDWLIKILGLISTFIFAYRQKQAQTMSVERREETKLMSSFD